MRKITLSQYLISSGDSVSQTVNAVLFASGNANESLSRRCYDDRDHWFMGSLRLAIDGLFYVVTYVWTLGKNPQVNHCEQSYRNDVKRAGQLLRCSQEEHDD